MNVKGSCWEKKPIISEKEKCQNYHTQCIVDTTLEKEYKPKKKKKVCIFIGGIYLGQAVRGHKTRPHWEETKKQDPCGKDMKPVLTCFKKCQEGDFPGAGRQKSVIKCRDHKWYPVKSLVMLRMTLSSRDKEGFLPLQTQTLEPVPCFSVLFWKELFFPFCLEFVSVFYIESKHWVTILT